MPIPVTTGIPLSLNLGELLHFLHILLKLPKDANGRLQQRQFLTFGFLLSVIILIHSIILKY